MSFHIGQILVHPFHGPVTVVSLEIRARRGENVEFVHLEAHESNLRIALPTSQSERVGLRSVMSEEGASELFEQLQAPSIELPEVWSRRFKELEERVASGELHQLVIVVRELVRRGPLAPASGEGRMLKIAAAKIALELSLAVDGATVEGTTQRIFEAAGRELELVGASRA